MHLYIIAHNFGFCNIFLSSFECVPIIEAWSGYMSKQSVIRGSVLLMLSAVIAKGLGALFRIPLTAMLGGSGMGYFSCAYGLFLPVFALSVTGMNTAVSAVSAGYHGKGQPENAAAAVRTAAKWFTIWGIAGSLLLYHCADILCTCFLKNPLAAPAVRAFSPAVFFCCINAVLRGEAEGRCAMEPTAVSQVIEGICRMALGLLLCRAAMQTAGTLPPDASGAAGAVFGVTLSTAAGTLTLLIFRTFRKHEQFRGNTADRFAVSRNLLAVLLPVAAASLVTNLTSLIDMATGIRLLTRILPGGVSDANFRFGAFSGLAMTVFNLVPSVTNMLGKSVLPAFAASWAINDNAQMHRHAEDVLRRTAFFAVPAGLGISALSAGALSLLFASRPSEIAAAAPQLRVLGLAVIFTAVSFPLFSMLQASGFAGDTVQIMLCGAAVKLAGNLLLIPYLGLTGAAWATVLCYAVIFCRSAVFFKRRTGVAVCWRRIWLRPLLGGILCAAAARSCYALLTERTALPVSLLLSVCFGFTVYMTWMLASGFLRIRQSVQNPAA